MATGVHLCKIGIKGNLQAKKWLRNPELDGHVTGKKHSTKSLPNLTALKMAYWRVVIWSILILLASTFHCYWSRSSVDGCPSCCELSGASKQSNIVLCPDWLPEEYWKWITVLVWQWHSFTTDMWCQDKAIQTHTYKWWAWFSFYLPNPYTRLQVGLWL